MSFFDINEDELKRLDGQIAIITGASSGIGLATTQFLLAKGASVIGVDLQPPAEAINSSDYTFYKADVTSWHDLVNLFKSVKDKHGRIDICFANAGVGQRADFLNLAIDEHGDPMEPTKLTLDVNLKAVINQVSLAAHYMQRQEPKGGSIVLTASCTGYQRFAPVDYVTAKHGIIGLLRSLSLATNTPHVPIRINAVAPSWTQSGLVTLPPEEFAKLGLELQTPHAVAKSVALLVSDANRHGQCLYSCGGRYVEMEGPMLDAMSKAIGKTGLAEEDERRRIWARRAELESTQ